MTKVYTIDLPGKYTHCTLNDDRTDNGKHIAEQVFYNEDKIISKTKFASSNDKKEESLIFQYQINL